MSDYQQSILFLKNFAFEDLTLLALQTEDELLGQKIKRFIRTLNTEHNIKKASKYHEDLTHYLKRMLDFEREAEMQMGTFIRF